MTRSPIKLSAGQLNIIFKYLPQLCVQAVGCSSSPSMPGGGGRGMGVVGYFEPIYLNTLC